MHRLRIQVLRKVVILVFKGKLFASDDQAKLDSFFERFSTRPSNIETDEGIN